MTNTQDDDEDCPRVETIPELGLVLEKVQDDFLKPVKDDTDEIKKSILTMAKSVLLIVDIKDSISTTKTIVGIIGASIASIALGYWLTLLGILPL